MEITDARKLKPEAQQQLRYQYGRSYAPMGQTPAIRFCARKESIGLISTLTNQGPMRLWFTTRMAAERCGAASFWEGGPQGVAAVSAFR